MREIKFRAWDKTTKGYLYNYREDGCSCEPFLSLNGKLMYEWVEEGGGGIGELEDDRYILQQYTGLHDKNGKEIYEGDILKSTEKPNQYTREYELSGIGVVVWSEKDTMYNLRWFDSNGRSVEPALKNMLGRYNEIIGNIYENPELINARK